MQRIHQLMFLLAVGLLCWLGMQAIHELGHILAAWGTGGTVTRVVLHPLSISRTDVSPNPRPGIVVWSGPMAGALLPVAAAFVMPRGNQPLRNLSFFFAAFCLIANGAYIALGAFDGVGDCGEMLRTGTPKWLLFFFGAVTVTLGLYLWHGLGSFRHFLRDPALVTRRMAYLASGLLAVLLILEFTLSGQ